MIISAIIILIIITIDKALYIAERQYNKVTTQQSSQTQKAKNKLKRKDKKKKNKYTYCRTNKNRNTDNIQK